MMESRSLPSSREWLAVVLTIAILYVVTGKLGFLWAIPPGNVTAVWAPSGIALAAVLLFGYRVWFGIWLGSFVVNTWFFPLLPAFSIFSVVAFATAASIAVGSTLQALLGAYLIRRFIGGDSPINRAADVFKFTGIEMASCLVAATFGVTSLFLSGSTPSEAYAYTWLTWWLGDLVGIIVVTPLVLSLSKPFWIGWKSRRFVEAMLLLGLLSVVSQMIFGGQFQMGIAYYPRVYIVIPLIVWAAFRFGQSGVMISILIASGTALWQTVQGVGPFVGGTIHESLLLLQAFMGIATMTGLIVAAAIAERKQGEEALQQSERHFRALIENSSDAVALVNADGLILYASPSSSRILGYTSDELVGRNGFELVHPDDLETAKRGVSELLQNPGKAITVERRIRHKDGSWRWIEATRINLLDEPSVRAIVDNYRDVTERKQAEERFRLVIEAAPNGMVMVNREGRIVFVNSQTEGLFGYTREELIGQSIEFLVPERSRGKHTEYREGFFTDPQARAMGPGRDLYGLRKDGQEIRVEIGLSPLVTAEGIFVLASIIDITERKQAEESLQRYAERLETLHEINQAILARQSPSAIAATVLVHLERWVTFHRASVLLFDFKAHEVTVLAARTRGESKIRSGKRLPLEAFELGSIESLRRGEIHRVEDILTHTPLSPVIQALKEEGMRSYVNIPLIAQNELIGTLNLGANRPGTFSPEHLEIAREVVVLLAVAIHQARLHEQVQSHVAKLEHQAMYDPLTGIPNRLLLQDRLQQAIRAGEREGKPVALLILDLDHFKEINDAFGHHFGDLLLQQIGPRLRSALRESDTLARLAGDEFVVLLPNTDAKGAVLLANKLLETLEAPFRTEGETVHIGTSIGIALFPEHGTEAETLMRHADVAIYLAKQGRGRYAVYASEQDPYSPARLARIDELRRAIDEGDPLVLLYQPQISLRSDRAIGVEALVRWDHPQHGMIPPDQFFPMAEQIGRIKPLILQLLKRALAQCQTWHRAGFKIPVAMNLPTRSLQDPQFPDQVAELLAKGGVAPIWLQLEITEGSIMEDPERATEILTRLSQMGVRLFIDDFGIGYTSLGLLKKLPVEGIKVDKSFVSRMGHNENDAVLVRSMIDLGHNLGLQVAAEGVESQEIWDRLVTLGCDAAQGYYISHPTPADELQHWLSDSPWGLRKPSEK